MSNAADYFNIISQLDAAKKLAETFPGKTIENIIQQLNSKKKYYESIKSKKC